MVRTIAVIPTISQIDSLLEILVAITDDSSVQDILIYDNGHTAENRRILQSWTYNPKIQIRDASGKSIYQMWNDGWRYARTLGETNVAILNDDIRVRPGTLDILGKYLRDDDSLAAVCPDYSMYLNGPDQIVGTVYVTSTFGNGGLAGFCFMLKAELPLPYIDENLKWWYGDDDLVKSIEVAGYRMGKIKGVPIEHTAGSSSKLLEQGMLRQMIDTDRLYFNQKYGENRKV